MLDNPDKPLTEQIIDECESVGFDRMAMNVIKHKLRVEKDIQFAVEIAYLVGQIGVIERAKQVMEDSEFEEPEEIEIKGKDNQWKN